MRLAMAGWMGWVLCVFAAPASAADAVKVPVEWVAYVEAVRKADPIADEEQRCLAHPDLPGNAWLPGAARARCALLRKPFMTLAQIDERLGSQEGLAGLEVDFAALLKAHYDDLAQREQIFRAFSAFDESPEAREVSDRWLAQAPKSAFALMASGQHYMGAGWHARGAKLMSKVPGEQAAAMDAAFGKAVPLLAAAFERNPRLSPACVGLMNIGRQSSGELEQLATGLCLKADPDSYYVVWATIQAAQPRWGGSPELLRQRVAYAAARTSRNPALGALLGEAAGDPLSMADEYGDVVQELDAVAKMAPSGTLIAAAGEGFRSKRDDWRAVVYLTQGLRFWPRNDRWRDERARALFKLGEHAWADRDMREALQVDDSLGWRNYTMGNIQRASAGGHAAARPYYMRAMQDPAARRAAYAAYCVGLLTLANKDEGTACTQAMVREFPEDGEAWRLRHWVLANRRDPAAAEARDQFIRYADPADALHRKYLEGLQRP